VLDAFGRRVRTLIDAPRSSGPGEVAWDLTDETGHAVATGVYWARFEAMGRTHSARVAVLR
jgi:hypothetical protein